MQSQASIPLTNHRFHSTKTEFELSIHFNDDTSLEISLPLNITLQSLYDRIFRERPELQGKSLRLIWRGSLLKGSNQMLGVLLRDAVVDASALENGDGPTTVHVQCAVSDAIESARNQEDAVQHRGLDRLLDLGLSREEVESLRNQFHSIRGREIPSHGTVEGNDAEHLAQLQSAEEAFLDNETQQVTEEDFSKELLVALMFGFFGGILSLIFLREAGWFTRRGQLGIMIGLLLNVSFGILRFSSV